MMMSSEDSKDELSNTKTKLDGQGYSSKDTYQSCRKRQGKWDHARRDDRQDIIWAEQRMQDLEDYTGKLKEKNKKLKAELKASKKSNSCSTKGDI
jgi:hypothetical protein